VIGKVIRGANAGRLLRYLYGPGRANEHVDPHLVAGFGDPGELEPERRPDGSWDLSRLTRLLAQPLAALAGPGYDKPVWHCAVRAAPGDRMLSDAEWERIAVGIMDRTALAPENDDLGVRWVAVRHAADHIHLVATLARQDGTRPRIWNDFFRVREACQDAEQCFGLRATAPADRTAARRPARAETEQATRRGWAEPSRVTLRREVCTAAAGARTEQDFFTRLNEAGVLTRKRYSTTNPGQVTGYAVGLPHHTTKGGGTVWYGGGKLAADLTLPKLRHRWTEHGADNAPFPGRGLSAGAARAVLRNIVTGAAEQARDEAGFFSRLRDTGVLVRVRFSETNPGQVTGYSVSLPGHVDRDGAPFWHGGGRLSADLTLPRLHRRWGTSRSSAAEQSGAFRFTVSERNAIYEHAARQATNAAEHIRHCAHYDPARAADAAWAAADTLHVAASALRNPALRRAADGYGRAARASYGRIPHRTNAGNQLRTAARLMALNGNITGESTLASAALIANLVGLAVAVAELREAQQHAAQAAAARAAAEHLHAACVQSRSAVPGQSHTEARRPRRSAAAADVGSRDFPIPIRAALAASVGGGLPDSQPGLGSQPSRGPQPPKRGGPGR
jgi:hypothetical protein